MKVRHAVAAGAAVENLEARQLLSAVNLGTDGVFNLVGDASKANTITVTLNSSGQIQGTVNGVTKAYATSSVKSLRIFGGNLADTLTVASTIKIPVYLDALGGNDTVISGSGNDIIYGGGGNDFIKVAGGNNQIHGHDGNDTLVGGAGADDIIGGSGTNILYGGGGADIFTGGTIVTTMPILGGSSTGGTDTSTSGGSSGSSSTAASPTAVVNLGTDGVFNLVGDASKANTITVTLNSSGQIQGTVNGVTKAYATSSVKSLRVFGGNLADTITIASTIKTPVYLDALDGDDTVISGSGNDKIYGGGGNDFIKVAGGNNQIHGHDGNDTLVGGAGADDIIGGNGTNILYGGGGADTFTGGTIVTTMPVLGGSSTGGTDTSTSGGSSGSSSTAASPTAVVTAMKTSVMAGTAVHVQALSSTYGTGSATTSRFQWDFGDASGKYNQLEGYNAAHIYDTPGTYNIRLTLTNSAGKSSVKTLSVTVAADTRKTIYVSPTGNDANDGSSTAKAIKSLSRLQSLLGDNTKVLFQRGGTWETEGSIGLYYKNMVLGAYGSGNAPILRGLGPEQLQTYGIGVIDTNRGNSDGVTIQDVTFDSNRPVVGTVANKNNTIGIWARGKNIAVRNCTFLNTSDAINANSQPQGLLVQDNTAPLATGIRGYFLWYEGEDGVVLGNTVANSTRERPMRMNAYNRVLIAYNDFTDLDRTSVDPSDGSKGSLWAMEGENVYIAHNDLHGILQTGPNFGINPITGRVGGNAERTRNLVVEANTLDSATRILHGVTDSIFRNNIAVVSKVPAFCLEAYSSDYQRQVENTIFANNTVINNTTIGSFMLLNGAAKGLQLLNNLYVANNLATGAGHSGGIISYTGDVSQFSKISGNVWSEPNISWYDKGKHYLWPTWFDNRGQIDAAEWEAFANVQNDVFSSVSLSSSYAPTSGAISTAPVVPGVFADFNGKTRPSGSWTAGAIQL